MKRIIGMFMAAAMMVGCSNDNDPVLDNGNEGSTAYMSVKIMSDDSYGTRAESPTPGMNDFDKNEEHKIENIDFYFFDGNGNAFGLNANGNCVNVVPPTGENDDNGESGDENIEVKRTVLVLNKVNGLFPTRMVTIVNPVARGAFAGMSFEKLKAEAAHYGKSAKADDYFVMTTSVYGEGGEGYTSITEKNLKSSKEEAKADTKSAVKVYVERILAKVGVETQPKFSLNDGKWYAKMTGWTVTGAVLENTVTTTDAVEKPKEICYLVKNIDSNWSDDKLGFSWNDVTRHRCYWANSPAGTFGYQFALNDFMQKEENAAETAEADPNLITNPKYFYEHTSSGNRSKLLVTFKYYSDKDCLKEVVPAEWNGTLYTQEDLKKAMASSIQGKIGYIEGEELAGKSVKPIEDYITIQQSKREGTKQYLSEAVFNSEKFLKSGNSIVLKGSDGNWKIVLNNTISDPEKTEAIENINAIMTDLLPEAKVWINGGYYYLDVKHLGKANSEAEYGVVRNHFYKYNITNVKGLGTPICNPDEIIKPQKPEDDESFVEAELNILSWRIVNHGDVTLE